MAISARYSVFLMAFLLSNFSYYSTNVLFFTLKFGGTLIPLFSLVMQRVVEKNSLFCFPTFTNARRAGCLLV